MSGEQPAPDEMDVSPTNPDPGPTTPAVTAASGPTTRRASLRAPQRERGAAASPAEYPTVQKRPRAPAVQECAPPPASDTFTYNTGEPEDNMAELKIMMRKVLADN